MNWTKYVSTLINLSYLAAGAHSRIQGVLVDLARNVKIVNGEKAEDGEFPFQVSIRINFSTKLEELWMAHNSLQVHFIGYVKDTVYKHSSIKYSSIILLFLLLLLSGFRRFNDLF